MPKVRKNVYIDLEIWEELERKAKAIERSTNDFACKVLEIATSNPYSLKNIKKAPKGEN